MNLKIRSTEKLATSNTKGLCDVERVITNYRDVYDDNGAKISTCIIIKSRMFQEQRFNKKIVNVDENEVEQTKIVEITERKYILGNDDENVWSFTNAQIENFKILLKKNNLKEKMKMSKG